MSCCPQAYNPLQNFVKGDNKEKQRICWSQTCKLVHLKNSRPTQSYFNQIQKQIKLRMKALHTHSTRKLFSHDEMPNSRADKLDSTLSFFLLLTNKVEEGEPRPRFGFSDVFVSKQLWET